MLRTLLESRLYGRTPTIRKLVIRKANYPIGLALWVNLSRILQNYLALKLPDIGSSTVQCYGLWNCKSGVVERFRSRYMLWIVTAEIQTASAVYIQRKIQLSGFSAYSDVSPSQLIRISGVVLYVASEGKYTKIKMMGIRVVENRGTGLYRRKEASRKD